MKPILAAASGIQVKYSSNDIKINQNCACIENRGYQGRCHDRRIQPKLLRQQRQRAADAFRHDNDRHHRNTKRLWSVFCWR